MQITELGFKWVTCERKRLLYCQPVVNKLQVSSSLQNSWIVKKNLWSKYWNSLLRTIREVTEQRKQHHFLHSNFPGGERGFLLSSQALLKHWLPDPVMEFSVPLTDKDSTKAFPYQHAWCQGDVLRWEPLQGPSVWLGPQQLIADTIGLLPPFSAFLTLTDLKAEVCSPEWADTYGL